MTTTKKADRSGGGNYLTTTEARERLEAAVRSLTSEDAWLQLLRMKSLQHNYTLSNLLLAWSQNRDMQLPLGGAKNFWHQIGRYPVKGSKALRVLAPRLITKEDDKTGEPKKVLIGFRAVPVFSADQTDGEPIPSVHDFVTTDVGEAPDGLLDALLAHADAEGLTVTIEDLPDGLGGYLRQHEKKIVLARTNAAKQVETLAHELSHWHDRANLDDYSFGGRPAAEIVAEGSAYVVAYAAGMDVSGYATGYVASWADAPADDAVKAIKAVAGRLDRAAAPLLKVVDGWRESDVYKHYVERQELREAA